MDDRYLVVAMVSADPRGLEGAYRRYGPPLLAYCRSLLADPAAAADVLHDTFILAGQRAGQLRDPDRLRPWLYAIARNECLRHLRRRVRLVSLEEAGDVAMTDDPSGPTQAAAVRELVWSAAEALNPGDREVFELAIRHDLSAPEIGAVLGVSSDHAHARLSRAKTQLERALGALLVARTGTQDCAELAGLLRGWNGLLTTLLRKRIGRHVDGCAICAGRQRRELHPAALFASYAGIPFVAVQSELWQRIQLTSGSPIDRGAILRRAERYDSKTGFPPTNRGRGPAYAAAATIAILLAAGGTFALPRLAYQDDAGTVVAAPTSSSPGPTSAVQSPSAGPSIITRPTASPTPDTSTTTTKPPPPPPAPKLSVTSSTTQLPCPDYHLQVDAKMTIGSIAEATLWYQTGALAWMQVPMDVTAGKASVDHAVFGFALIKWYVVAKATSGTTYQSPQRTHAPC